MAAGGLEHPGPGGPVSVISGKLGRAAADVRGAVRFRSARFEAIEGGVA